MSTVSSSVREITVAHSPDSDDAFMFYALATRKIYPTKCEACAGKGRITDPAN